MSILQSFLAQFATPSSGINATGGNFIDISAGASGTAIFKRHIFTGPGTFTVNQVPPTASITYLVVAGGGGGGTDNVSPPTIGFSGGGGGGGGWRLGTLPISQGSYPVIVGAGGAGGTPTLPSYGAPGSNSSFDSIVSTGGGGGAGLDGTSPGRYAGLPGGSGGGSRRWPTNGTPAPTNGVAGGTGTSGQGFPGGIIPAIVSPTPPVGSPAPAYLCGFNGSGGGGARLAGVTQPFSPVPGLGTPVDGTVSSRGGLGGWTPLDVSPIRYGDINFREPTWPGGSGIGGNTSTYFAAGGNGGVVKPAPSFPAPSGTVPPPTSIGFIDYPTNPFSVPLNQPLLIRGTNGLGGGGNNNPFGPACPGIVNTGGGGGGYGGLTPGSNGGAGGPGIVIISYPW